MTAADLVRLKQSADLVRFDSWPDAPFEYQGDSIEYIATGTVQCIDPGDEMLGTLSYDTLPADIRALVESVPLLIAEVEKLRERVVPPC